MTTPATSKHHPASVRIVDGVCQFHPQGEYTLVEAVQAVTHVIQYCQGEHLKKLLVNATGMTRVTIPTLVDRFLMMEEWAHEARGMDAIVLVVHPEYIHPKRFGVVVAADLGLTCNVATSDAAALAWLATALPQPHQPSA